MPAITPRQNTSSTNDADIAVIGMNCNFPGGAYDYHQFWQRLLEGYDAITETPKDRWDLKKFYSSNPEQPAKSYAKKAGFLHQSLEDFDPLFFGISPREAEAMDPQQRLLLEVCWQAIEDSGLTLDKLHGSKTAVFIGGFCLDNQLIQLSELNRELIDSHSATSSSMTLLASRLSYVFDLKGPCLTLDTACSSALVAIHYAAQSILNQEATMAIAGGVNAILKPENSIVMSKGKFLSPDSKCMTFDEKANGYVRGEGAGLIILKSLSQAIEDNDRIHAVIKASGVNQDGQTLGITLPNGEAQQELMQSVYQKAQVDASQIGYIEAHGTGTQAGDITEINSINTVFRDSKQKTFIGSVKTNIGHLEAAAGVAGLIKTILCLKHKKIPANLHFDSPNPALSFDHLIVPTTSQDWQQQETSYAAVNSFGYGGTNAHVLLKAYQAPKTQPSSNKESQRLIPIKLSAQSNARLTALIKRHVQWLMHHPQLSIDDIAHTLNHKKTSFNHRLIVLVNSTQDLLEKLTQYINDDTPSRLFTAKSSINECVFVCTGMGPQWAGMGKALFKHEPLYRQTVLECDEIFQGIAKWSILDELFNTESDNQMHEPQIAQVANFILQVALSNLLASWGIKAQAMVGHSVGEIAAFYLSGAISLKDALKISFHRARLQNTLQGSGEMLAVNLAASEVQVYLDGQDISIAAINSPSNISLAGDKEQLIALSGLLNDKNIFNRLLNVNLAYHSSFMDEIKEAFLKDLGDVSFTKPNMPLYSTVSGKEVDVSELTASYWWENIRHPVQFNDAVISLLDDGFNAFIELGPHPVLKNYLDEISHHQAIETQIFHTLNRREHDERCHLLANVCRLACHGLSINYDALCPNSGQFIDTPYQPWMKEKFWRESLASKNNRFSSPGASWFANPQPSSDAMWQVELNDAFFPYLKGHKVADLIVFPAASYIEAALSVNKEINHHSSCVIEDMRFEAMLIHDDKDTQTLQLSFQQEFDRFSLYSQSRAKTQRHCSATLYSTDTRALQRSISLEDTIKQLRPFVTTQKLYQQFSQLGLNYEASFQTIKALYCDKTKVLAKLETNPLATLAETPIAPTLLDGAFQSLIALKLESNKAYLPQSVDKILYFNSVGHSCWSHGQLLKASDSALLGNIEIFNNEGTLCLKIIGLRLKAASLPSSQDTTQRYHQLQWVKQSLPTDMTHKNTPALILHDGQQEDFISSLLKQFPNVKSFVFSPHATYTQDDTSCANDLEEVLKTREPRHIVYVSSYPKNVTLNTVSCQTWPLVLLAKSLAKLKHGTIHLSVVSWLAQDNNGIKNLSAAPIANLCRVIENENPSLLIKTIDLDYETSLDLLCEELMYNDFSDTVCYRSNNRYIQKLFESEIKQREEKIVPLNEEDVEIKVVKSGALNRLNFIAKSARKLTKHEVKIKVIASAINYKDILKIDNKLDEKITDDTFFGKTLGMEVSGIVVEIGERVSKVRCGDLVIAPLKQNFSSFAYIDENYVLTKPSTLTFYQAPILTVFLAAYHGLVQIANLQAGEKVLIHSATGGVGLAAIQIAQYKNAEIYATAGTEEKRNYLKNMGINHLYDSRSCDFKEQILKDTMGYGVDVVINSIAGNKLIHSFNLLAPYGRFIEIGKKDIAENTLLPMQAFNRNISFSSLDIDRMLVDKMDIITPASQAVLQLFEQGVFKALPTKVFKAGDVNEAFQFMSQSRHIGKVVLDYQNQHVPVGIHKKNNLIDPRASYLITGGTQGFGLEVGKLLLHLGANNVYLLSRRGTIKPSDDDARFKVRAIDVCDKKAMQSLIDEIQLSPTPLKGVIHSAMVLEDALINQLEKESFEKVLSPKITGALNLHDLSKDLSLDFFMQFSSVSSLIGNIGQASYVVANAFLDALGQYRQEKGLPCTTINWGVLAEVGVVSRDDSLSSLLDKAGIGSFDTAQALEIVKQCLQAPSQNLGAFELNWGVWARQHLSMAKKSVFGELIESQVEDNSDTQSRHDKLKGLSEKKRCVALAQILRSQLASILQTKVSQIELTVNINQYGIDSILAIELVNSLKSSLHIAVSPTDFMDSKSINELAHLLSQRF